jgi:hypothetical protein
VKKYLKVASGACEDAIKIIENEDRHQGRQSKFSNPSYLLEPAWTSLSPELQIKYCKHILKAEKKQVSVGTACSVQTTHLQV